MSIRDVAVSVLAQKDMEDFIKHEIKEKLPKTEDDEITTPRSVFVAFSNFPGNLHFQQMIDAWVHESGGIHTIIGDRYRINAMRGKRYDLLWVDFRIGSRLGYEDIEYIVSILAPETKRLLVTYNTFILHNYETNEYEIYASMDLTDFIAVVRNDTHTMKIEGVVDPKWIRIKYPLRFSYLLKRAWKRLFRRGK